MANNKIQVKRTTVSGRTPNTTGSYSTNSQYIAAGEFALNMADGILYSSNGSTVIAIGANNTNVNITGNAVIKAIIANGSIGSGGEILASNGSGLYWTSVGGTGTVTQIDTGNGLSGGPITGTGTISVVANDGIIANSSGLFVKAGTGIVVNTSGVHVTAGVNTDAQYIWTNTHTFNQTINGTTNNSLYLGGNSASDLRTYSDNKAANAYSNAVSYTDIAIGTANSAITGNAATAYTNAVSYVDGVIVNVNTAITSNASAAYTNAVSYVDGKISTANSAITGNASTAYTNAVSYTDSVIATANSAITGNSATAYSNSVSYVDGKSYVNTSQLSANLSNYQTTTGLAANVATLASNSATYLGNSSGTIANVATWITSNASAAYTNAVSYTDGKIATANSAITGNSATAYSNAVSYTDGKILTANSAITGNAATAYTNATIFASNASNINTGTLAEARLPYRMDQNVRTTDNVTFGNITISGNLTVDGTTVSLQGNTISFTDNMLYLNQGIEATITNVSGNGTYVTFTANNNYSTGWDVSITGVNPSSYNGNYSNIFLANATHFVVANTNTNSYVSGGIARGKTDSNPDLGFAAGYNDGTYHHAGFFRDASDGIWKVFDGYLPEPDESVFIDTTNTTFRIANFQANVVYVGNTTVYSTVNTTSFSGTANNTLFVGSVAAANIVSNTQLQANIQYFVNTSQLSSNLSNYVTTTNLTNNLSNYQTTAGLAANVALLAANSATYLGNSSGTIANVSTWITSNASAAYTNAVSYVDGKSFVNTSQLSSNLSNYVTTTNLTNNLANYQTTAGLNANIAAYLPTYTGVVNGSSFTVGSNFIANSTAVYTTGSVLSYTTIEWPIESRFASTTATNRPSVLMQRANNTIASPTAVTSGMYLGGISMGGYDGSNWSSGWNGGAEVMAVASEAWSNTAKGTGLFFNVTAAGSNSLSLGAAYLAPNGNFGIGNTSPGNKLTVEGGITELRSGGYLMLRPTANDWDMRLQANTGNRLDILSGGALSSPIMTWVHGGNIGIGNTAPTDKLSVNGSSYFGGNQTVTGSVTIATNQVIDSSGAQFRTGAGNYGVRVFPGGGTDTTMSILQLTNAAKDAQWGSFYSNGVVSSIGSDITGVPFYLRANNATIVTLAANGNFGIGTTSPAYKLDVTSSARIVNHIFDGSAIELNASGTGNRYAYIDFHGDDTYTDYSFRVIRENTGPNALSGLYHRGTGAFNISALEAAPIVVYTNSTNRIFVSAAGNVGIGNITSPAYTLQVNGSFAATTKSFVIKHPTKPNMKLRYGSLEGPENGVYVRGRSVINIIELPDYWVNLIDEDSITVQLTPIGKHQNIYVEKIEDNKVYIKSSSKIKLDYFYMVNAERKDVDKLEVEVEDDE